MFLLFISDTEEMMTIIVINVIPNITNPVEWVTISPHGLSGCVCEGNDRD